MKAFSVNCFSIDYIIFFIQVHTTYMNLRVANVVMVHDDLLTQ